MCNDTTCRPTTSEVTTHYDCHKTEGHYEMMGGVCLSVRPSDSLCVPRTNLRIERPVKPKIGAMEAHHINYQ